MPFRCLPLTGAVLLLVACSPVMDWREVRPDASGLVLMLPCKPASHARMVVLAGTPQRLTLYACTAGDATWAVAYTDMVDPARVGPALRELRGAAAANLGTVVASGRALTVPGETPYPDRGRFELHGKLPDGKVVREQLAVFARGPVVFQVTVLGDRLEADSVEAFFTSVRFTP